MADDLSTSARLLQCQRDLAASRADLTRVERERDELQAIVNEMPCGWCDGVGVAPAERFGRDADGAPNVDEDLPCPEGCEVASWLQAERNDAADIERERDLLRAELATARADLETLRSEVETIRSWQVARDDYGLTCTSCEQPIDRGQAVEPVPEAKGWFRHVHCPSWTVATTDIAEGCGKCERAIRRGEAYVLPLPGVGLFMHVYCATEVSPPNPGAGPREEHP